VFIKLKANLAKFELFTQLKKKENGFTSINLRFKIGCIVFNQETDHQYRMFSIINM